MVDANKRDILIASKITKEICTLRALIILP